MRKNSGDTQNIYHTQREYYRSIYASSQSAPWEGFFDGQWLAARLKSDPPKKGQWAVEIGAGRGRGTAILARAGYLCVGMDYLLEPMGRAEMRSQRRGPAYVNADLMAAPFKPGVFSLALDWGVFHHIKRKDTAMYIRASLGLLGEGGRLLLGCFSPKFRHEGEKARKRPFKVHHGHYDRFSTRRELYRVFAPWFEIASIEERQAGYYLLDMKARKD